MADSVDIANQIADDVASLILPLVGTTYQITEQIDAETYGPERTVPSTMITISRPTQQVLEDRVGQGKATITVEADVHDGPMVQFANEGRQQDLIDRTPITVSAVLTAPNIFTFSGSATAGNIVGVQLGTVGASYVVAVGDTIGTIVSNLAAACVSAGLTASSDGQQTLFVVPGAGVAAVVNIGTTSRYLAATARRRKNFDIMCWVAGPFDRHFYVTALENLYAPGTKIALPDGSDAVVSDFLGTIAQDGLGDGEQRDSLYIARIRWLIDFTVTRLVTKTEVVATTVTFDSVDFSSFPPLTASQL